MADTDPLATRMPFQMLCTELDKFGRLKAAAKRAAVDGFIANWMKTDPAHDIYPVMRLLLPHLDRARNTYGMKQSVLAKRYIDALGLARDSRDALILTNWTAPRFATQHAGDFGAVAYKVLLSRCPGDSRLTIAQVNDHLDQLHVSETGGSKLDVIRTLVTTATALENKWLARMILKEMKIGISENTIFMLYHPDAQALYNVCSDLEKVCHDLRDPNVRIAHQVQLFAPFKPMLAAREPLADIPGEMGDSPFVMEIKLDGERMQLHKQGGRYKYFSRKGKDYTYMYGESAYEGSLTPHIHNDCFGKAVTDCILDGEMIAFDPITGTFAPFTTLKTAALDRSEDASRQRPCFVVFDIVYLNGECVISQQWNVRRQLLESILQSKKGWMQIAEITYGRTVDDLIQTLDKAIADKEEGLIIKNQNSLYLPSKRLPDYWIKLKPEYLDNIATDLDLLIIGGYYSEGVRRGGRISHFLVALMDDKVMPALPSQGDGEGASLSTQSRGSQGSTVAGKRFLAFARVGGGITDAELQVLTDRLEPHWQRYDKQRGTGGKGVTVGRLVDDLHVWIPPEQSIVMIVKASEIVKSEHYACHCTLRFPRFVGIHPTKQWDECMTLEEMQALRKAADGRLTGKRGADDEGGGAAKKRRQQNRPTGRRGRVFLAPHLVAANIGAVEKKGELFANLEFCVMNGDEASGGKRRLEVLISEEGGAVVQNPTPATFCIIADELKVKVTNMIKAGTHDILRSAWLLQSIDERTRLPLQQRHIVYVTPATRRRMARHSDRFGDGFSDAVTVDDLREIVQHMPDPTGSAHAQRTAVWALHAQEIAPDDTPLATGAVVIGVVLHTTAAALAVSESSDRAIRATDGDVPLLQQALARAAAVSVEMALQRIALRGALIAPLVFAPDLGSADAVAALRTAAQALAPVPVTHVIVADALTERTDPVEQDVAQALTRMLGGGPWTALKVVSPDWVERWCAGDGEQ